MNMKPHLIVSVRSVAEARNALSGGCQFMDIKEPDRGPLGRADDDIILKIAESVQKRVPVSAALGEWAESGGDIPAFVAHLQFVKWGLAGMAGRNWRAALRQFAAQCPAVCVVAAYADVAHARSPSVDEIVDFVCDPCWPGRVLLLDTFDKLRRDGRPMTLLDWLPLKRLAEVCGRCRALGVRIALAGSLGENELRTVATLQPDWVAVRGAACDQHDRRRGIQVSRVRTLRGFLEENATTAAFAG
jgi:uncharacterized protein (UPF0264 family)